MCAKVNGRQGPELKAKEAQALLFQVPCHYGDRADPDFVGPSYPFPATLWLAGSMELVRKNGQPHQGAWPPRGFAPWPFSAASCRRAPRSARSASGRRVGTADPEPRGCVPSAGWTAASIPSQPDAIESLAWLARTKVANRCPLCFNRIVIFARDACLKNASQLP